MAIRNDQLVEAAGILRQVVSMLDEASEIQSVWLRAAATDAAKKKAPELVEQALAELRKA